MAEAYLSDDDVDDGSVAEMSDVELLRTVWVNERCSPELQYIETELIARIRESLQQQKEELAVGDVETLEGTLLQLSYDRVQYLLRSYLRTRLKKIQRFAIHILSNEEVTQRLSEQEYNFATRFVDLIERHMKATFLSRVPDKFDALDEVTDDTNMVTQPDLASHVVVRVNEDLGTFVINAEGAADGDGDEVDLRKGDVLIAPYQPFQELLGRGLVDLL